MMAMLKGGPSSLLFFEKLCFFATHIVQMYTFISVYKTSEDENKSFAHTYGNWFESLKHLQYHITYWISFHPIHN